MVLAGSKALGQVPSASNWQGLDCAMLQVEKARLDHGKGQRVNQGDSCLSLA